MDKKNKKNPINIIISASEITKGMKSVGSKALLKIRGETSIIEYQIKQLKQYYPKSHIYISTGFESEKIVRVISKYKNVSTIYNPDYKSTNQCCGIIQCIEKYDLSSALVISNGIVFKEVFDFDNRSTVFIINKDKTSFNIGCGASDDTNLAYLFYDLPKKWTECAFLNKQAIDSILALKEKQNINQLFLFEIINELIDNGESFNISAVEKKNILKINGIKDIRKARIFCNESFCTEI